MSGGRRSRTHTGEAVPSSSGAEGEYRAVLIPDPTHAVGHHDPAEHTPQPSELETKFEQGIQALKELQITDPNLLDQIAEEFNQAIELLAKAYELKKRQKAFKNKPEYEQKINALIDLQKDFIIYRIKDEDYRNNFLEFFNKMDEILKELSSYTQAIVATEVIITEPADRTDAAYGAAVKLALDSLGFRTTDTSSDVSLGSDANELKPHPPTDLRAHEVRVSKIMLTATAAAAVASRQDARGETHTELKCTPKELTPKHYWKTALENTSLDDRIKNLLIERYSELVDKKSGLFAINQDLLREILKTNGVKDPKDTAKAIIKDYQKQCTEQLYTNDLPNDAVIKLSIALVEEQCLRHGDPIVIQEGVANGPVFVEAIRLYCLSQNYKVTDRSEWKEVVTEESINKKIEAFSKRINDNPAYFGYRPEEREQLIAVEPHLPSPRMGGG